MNILQSLDKVTKKMQFSLTFGKIIEFPDISMNFFPDFYKVSLISRLLLSLPVYWFWKSIWSIFVVLWSLEMIHRTFFIIRPKDSYFFSLYGFFDFLIKHSFCCDGGELSLSCKFILWWNLCKTLPFLLPISWTVVNK